jgi:4-hydroxybenzoate polyprenyltransferase
VSATYRTLNAARRIGYSLLPGDTFSYLMHLRPREWPIMVAHTALGVILAWGLRGTLDRLTTTSGALTVLTALCIWVLCLNGGTLAINSAFDRDEGDIGYLDAPPPVPRHLAVFSMLLMAVGQVWSLIALPLAFSVAYATCFAMSLLYSVPPVRLKAVAGADWLINMIGFGSLTPFAGWAATGASLTTPGFWVIASFCPLFAALYPLTQLYQVEEDRARGDRTLAIVIGLRASLAVAIVATVVAFAGFARAGWLAPIHGFGWQALGVALIVWLFVLVRWLSRAPRMSPGEHKRGMYAALGAWAVTDVAVIMAFAWRIPSP